MIHSINLINHIDTYLHIYIVETCFTLVIENFIKWRDGAGGDDDDN